MRSALRVQLRPPSRLCLQNLRHCHNRPMKLCLSHGNGMKSECLFRGSRAWRTLKNKDQDTVCKTECVRACEHARRLPLIRRLVRFDGVGHMLLRHNLHVLGHKRFHQMRILGAALCANSLFICKIQSTVWEIRTAERQFHAPHAASDSRRESSPFTWSSH